MRHRRPIRRPSKWLAASAAGLLGLAACQAEDAPVSDPDPAEGAVPELGAVEFTTSCSPQVEARLEEGLLLLHHMMYAQAQEAFLEAVAVEEECAMAHWGVAMARFQPLWGSADVEGGREPAERAVALDPPTERERAYARSALAFYEDPDAGLSERIERWEAAMEELYELVPEDLEAASLYALAHLAVDPADPDRQERAIGILDRVHEELPEHPGAIHYGIHAHDVDARAEAGVRFAAAYQDIAPTVPHALHMPSHIYVRIGDWDAVIDWNRRSADAALEAPVNGYISHHHPHALDYLMYGYLQRGEDEAAREVLEELRSREGYQPTFISGYALGAIPARWHVERRDWDGASELEPRLPEDFPWDDFPAAEAMTHVARGLGAARTGDASAARASAERLGELELRARDRQDAYWGDWIAVQRRSVAAWAAFAEGDVEGAVEEMRTAAELEEAMEKHPITPGDLQPAYELLGDLLLEAGRPGEALEAYQTSLETWPNRYHTLLGAARVADEIGDDEAASRYYGELAELAGDAAPEREGAAEARERAGR